MQLMSELLIDAAWIFSLFIMFATGVLCAKFQTIVFYTKILTFLIFSSILTILSIPHTLLLFPLRDKLIYPLLWMILRVARMIGTTFEFRGRENITDHSSVIILNHQCFVDLGVMSLVRPYLGRSVVFLINTIMYVPFYGILCYIWRSIYINPLNSEESRRKLNDCAETLIKNKMKVIIYPEGKRNETDKFFPFKKGAFFLAIQTKVPIQPIVSSRHIHFKFKDKLFKNGKVIVEAMPEIPTDNITINDINSFIEKVKEQMEIRCNQLTEEVKILNNLIT